MATYTNTSRSTTSTYTNTSANSASWVVPSFGSYSALLKETGGFLLKESDSGKILLESSTEDTWTNTSIS